MTADAPEAHWFRSHIDIWIGVGVVLALVALFGIGVLVGRSTKSTESPQGLAQKEVVAAIDGSLAALNRGDFKAWGSYWAENAGIDDRLGLATASGRQAIVEAGRYLHNMGGRFYRVGAVVQRGDLAAYVISCPTCDQRFHSGINLVEFTDGWKIDYMWTGNAAGPEPAP